MRLDHLISDTLSRLLGRLLKRAIAGAVIGLFLLAVIYQLAAAGTLALGEVYGMVNARLIVAAVMALPVLGAVAYLILSRRRPKPVPERVQSSTLGLAMLLETLVLGYALAREKPRSTLKRT